MDAKEIIEELELLVLEWKGDIREMKANGMPDHAKWTQSDLSELEAIIRRAKHS